jgi:hypothetical protein
LDFFLQVYRVFFGTNLLLFSDSSEISFLPQGIVLVFYGTVGSILGIFIALTAWWNVGSGYNEFNRQLQEIKVFRQGFPGKNRELMFTFAFNQVKSVKMRIKEGLNPKRQLLLSLVDGREIPLTGIEQPVALNKIEDEAITIAKYLNVFLETE